MSPHFNATGKLLDNDDDESAKGKGLEGEKAFCFTSLRKTFPEPLTAQESLIYKITPTADN